MTTKRIYCRNQTSSSGNKKGERLIQQEESYHEQIAKFYENKLPSNREIRLGKTPEVLQKLGAKDLPLVMKQSDLRKSIREPKGSRSAHQIDRKIIERIPELVDEPIIVVDEIERNSLALICDCKEKNGYNLLVAIKLDAGLYGNMVNQIKSIYGKEHLIEYLQKFPDSQIHTVDKEKAKYLSPTRGLQLPKAPIKLDYKKNIPQKTAHVKQEDTKNNNLRDRSDIAKDVRKAGFTPTKNLINYIRQLDGISGINHTMRDICNTYKNGCKGCNPEEKELIHKITQECKKQEMVRAFMPER